jgi:hypothetical protein
VENDDNEAKINAALTLSRSGNVLDFFTMLSGVSEQVQLKVLEQLPEFRALAVNAIDRIKSAYVDTLDAHDKSLDRVHRAFEETRAALIVQLDTPDLSFEQKMQIADRIADTARQQADIHEKVQHFLDTWYGKTLAGIGLASVAVLAFFVTRKGGGGLA